MATSSWKARFAEAVTHFRAGKYTEALDFFSQTLALDGDSSVVYDSRAAVYEKLGKFKEALLDAKRTIDLRPDRWQGYARSARLFFQARKYAAASRMVDLALERVPSDQSRRMEELVVLRREIAAAIEAAARHASRTAYHFGKLPVEVATTIFSMVLEEDHAYVVNLAQVCQNWRSISLGTPSFWRTLALGRSRPKRKVKLWRERARDRIHEIAVLETCRDHVSALEELHSIPTNHLRVLRLEGHQIGPVIQAMTFLTPDTAASLHSVTLLPPSTERLPLSPGEMPELQWRVLKLAHLEPLDYYNIATRSAQLEALSLSKCRCSGADWPEFLLILHHNQNLAKLELVNFATSYGESPRVDDLPPTIIAPALAEIRVEGADDLANILLPLLARPPLKTFRVSTHRQRLDAALIWLAASPAATLTTLSIQRSTVDPNLLINALASAVALESLQLNYLSNVASRVLEALGTKLLPNDLQTKDQAGSPNSFPVVHCPALRHLDVSHCPDTKARPVIAAVKLRLPEIQSELRDSAQEVIRDKLQVVQRLESLVMDGCPDVDPEVLPWLRVAVPSVSCIYMVKKDATWKR
ncbi:hypothetical protein BD413DRAFT_601160 [Trametes elegans]|nr:hypothetical protein BD413DRAFT_601160 [Trametes elegans]